MILIQLFCLILNRTNESRVAKRYWVFTPQGRIQKF